MVKDRASSVKVELNTSRRIEQFFWTVQYSCLCFVEESFEMTGSLPFYLPICHLWGDQRKSKDQRSKNRTYPVLNPTSKLTCQIFSLRMEQFKPIRRLVVEDTVGTSWLGKWLGDLVHAKQFPEGIGCILRALVAVKHQLSGLVSVLICLTEGGSDQIGAVLGRYPVGNYFPRKQVEDHADIEILAIDFKADDVADPDAVRFIRF